MLVSPAVSERLARLARQLPTAIVTGRSVADVRTRLGFEPHFVTGNHGAEDDAHPDAAARHARVLDPLRALLREHAAELREAGLLVEDKAQSIALHYRLARNRARAAELARSVCAAAAPAVREFGGKMVVNAIDRDAPDKAQAVHAIAHRCGARDVFFAGDDVNDEPVFASAPANWLTVRIGRDDPDSRARFFLDGQREVAMLLDRMLGLLGAGPDQE